MICYITDDYVMLYNTHDAMLQNICYVVKDMICYVI